MSGYDLPSVESHLPGWRVSHWNLYRQMTPVGSVSFTLISSLVFQELNNDPAELRGLF